MPIERKQRGNPTITVAAIIAAAALVLGLLVYLKDRAPSRQAAADSLGTASGTHEVSPATPDDPSLSQAAPSARTAEPPPATHSAAAAPARSLGELVATLNDPSLPMSQRRRAIRELAKLGSSEAMAALKSALTSTDPALRAAIAESLGAATNEQSTQMMLQLLNDPDAGVVQAAIRGLAVQGSPKAVTALAQVLHDAQRPLNVRCEAASNLGTIHQPGVVAALTQAAMSIRDEDVLSQVLVGLGQQPITETSAFFDSFIKSPAVAAEMKVEAVEALADAPGDVANFLATLAGNADPEIRASAAWALSATDEPGNLGPQLLALVQRETDPDVRLRLYEALRNQENFETTVLPSLVQKETDAAARLAAMDLVAKVVRDQPTPGLLSYFEQTALPDLRNTAFNGTTGVERNAALLALARARTPGAVNVLTDLAQNSGDPHVRQAAANYFKTISNK